MAARELDGEDLGMAIGVTRHSASQSVSPFCWLYAGCQWRAQRECIAVGQS
jgi:hypothetical protein